MKRLGYVHFDSWAGRTKHMIEILSESPKRYTVRLLESAFRYAEGKILHPPKHAVVEMTNLSSVPQRTDELAERTSTDTGKKREKGVEQ